MKILYFLREHRRVSIGFLFMVFLAAYGAYSIAVPARDIVGVAFANTDVPRWQIEAGRIRGQLEEKGYEVAVRFAEGDETLQEAQIRELVDVGARVIIVNPVDATKLVPVMRDAQKQGVKFIAHDRLILGGYLDYFTTIRMQDVGRIAAEHYLVANAGKNLVYIAGDPADTNARYHREGVMQALENAIDRGDVVLQGDLVAFGWTEDESYRGVKGLLAKGVPVDAVIGGNDSIAAGAYRALGEAGISNVFIAGGDATVAACRAILDGAQTLTLYKSSVAIANASARAAEYLIRGDVPPVYGLADNGFMRVPSAFINPVPIDASNVQIEGENCAPRS